MLFVNKLKVLTLMTCLAFVGQGFAADCAANYAPPENLVWDGTSTEEPCTIGGYYIIDNAKKLAWYAAYGSDNKGNFTRGNAKLTADIDLGGKLWTPIAAGKGGATEYTKIFDGNGHVIYNLYIKASELAQKKKEYAQNLGFVAVLGGGQIKNLILENVDIQAATNAGSISGMTTDNQISVGSFVGWMSEKNSSIVDACMATGTIRTTGNGQGVGGIVGNAKKGSITNCMSLVEIRTSGSDAYIGGIIGLTKTDVTVSSCVYAGPGLVNTGDNGLVGGIAGNVFTGKLTTTDNYFEGENINGIGGSICKSSKKPTECTEDAAKKAAASIANAHTQNVDITNAENVACELNGKNEDGSCKTEPWAVGETGLSLNGYGKDGYKITFIANEGAFADGSIAKNVFLQAGMAITANEIGNPSRDYYSLVGWAFTQDATESDNLGFASQRDTVFAVWEKKIKVTFDANGGAFLDGSEEKDVYITKGDPITVDGLGSLPFIYCNEYSESNPTQCLSTMYFTGWKDDAETTVDFNNHDVFATEDVTYKAIWTDVKTYSVTFHANNNTTVDIVVYVDDGETLTSRPANPTMDGYDFEAWYDGEVEFDFDSEIESSKDLYAHWSPKQYGIAYVLGNGGLDKGDNPVAFTMGEGILALEPPTAKDGYIFDGWFYDSDFKQKATSIDGSIVGDKTFYAKFSKIQYRIMYLADNSSQGAVTDQYKEYGVPFTLESAGYFNRKGYGDQIGWAIEANGEKVYEFGATYENNAALTLYPAWGSPIEYTITYVCDVCTGDNPDKPNPHTYTVNDTKGINLPIYNPTYPNNYEFKGWYWDKAYTKRTTNIPKDTVGNLTLYGKTLKYYYLAYELYGSTKANNPEKYTIESTFTLKDPAPRAGYTFGGWYTEDTFINQITEIQLGSSEDMTLHAKWIPNTYTVTYDAGEFGDGSIAAGTKTHDVDFELSDETFTRTGYTQDGWENADGDIVSSPYTENADITLYPHWVINTYTVTYDAGEFGEGSVAAGTKTFDVDFVLSSETFTRTGYTQNGWEDVNGDIVSSPYTENADITLYPHWVINTYTVTYDAGEFGEGSVAAGTKTFDVDFELSAETFTRTGYTQDGWENAKGDIVSSPYTENADITLYPHWSLVTYTITYVVNGDENIVTQNTYTIETGAVFPTSLSLPFDGYDFVGWEDENGNPIEGLPVGSYGDRRITAQLSAIEYAINYDLNGGSFEGAYPENYTIAGVASLPTPVNSGSKFLGWFNDEDALVTSIEAGTTGAINLTAKWAEFPILVATYGGIEIFEDEDGTTAQIDGYSTEDIDITTDVEVDHVVFNRTFSEKANSTIMLPFSISVNDVEGGTFYDFANLEKKEDGKYHFEVREPAAMTLEANKPYIFIPSAEKLTFKNTDPVVFNTSEDNFTSSGYWHFLGTYSTRIFKSSDEEFGFAYGFAGEEKNGLTLGKFHKVKENARLLPMRGYLLYDENRSTQKSANVNASEWVSYFDLPEEIDVDILNNSGIIIGGGTFNTHTGTFKLDRWYDLQGRKLNGKPTVQGTYYHNGKRVIVK